MNEIETAGVMTKIVEALAPLASEERLRVVRAALTLLGETAPIQDKKPDPEGSDLTGEVSALPARARAWIQQNGLSFEQLQQVFQFSEGSVEVIATEMPGQNDKEKSFNAYILTGIAKLLATNAPAFDDDTARTLCKASGCFNLSNHSGYMAQKGNEFTGSKLNGWTLTAPGLKRGATLVRELTKQA